MSNVSIVVETKACSGCGMCAAACPVNAIEIEEAYRPRVLDSCNDCGICYEVCPRVEIPYGEIERNLAEKHQANKYDEFLGFYTGIFLARSSDETVLRVAYSGGTTTTFIRYLLEQKLIDAALLTDKAHNLTYCAHPKPRVVTNPDDVLSCAFTKPTVNPILSQLPVEGDQIAFVGNSCHIEAVRKAQFLAEKGGVSKKRCNELVGNIRFLVGLNCFFCNNPEGIDILLSSMNLKESDIKRWFYDHGKPTVELPDGTIRPVYGANQNFDALNVGCLLCYPSYTSRLSDVTFGKTMSKEWGWNDVICRSEEVDGILTEMENKGLIENKNTEDGGDELLASMLEAEIFKMDAMGYSNYLETGSFSPDETAAEMLSNRPGGTIKGETLMKLIQAVRKYSFYEPAVSARKAKNIFVPRLM